MEELIARLDTIQRLLVIVLSDRKYQSAIEDLRDDLYEQFDVPLNTLFPSDPEYQLLEAESRHLRAAVGEILGNIEE